jgi:hypothetical protein
MAAIGDEIRDALNAMLRGDTRAALRSALIATAATSRKMFPNRKKLKDGAAFQRFVHNNIDIIFHVASGGAVRFGSDATWVFSCDHPELRNPPETPENAHTVEEILYKVRCDLIHNAEISPEIQFSDKYLITTGNPLNVADHGRGDGRPAATRAAARMPEGHWM